MRLPSTENVTLWIARPVTVTSNGLRTGPRGPDRFAMPGAVVLTGVAVRDGDGTAANATGAAVEPLGDAVVVVPPPPAPGVVVVLVPPPAVG